jgi:hypothetical protein
MTMHKMDLKKIFTRQKTITVTHVGQTVDFILKSPSTLAMELAFAEGTNARDRDLSALYDELAARREMYRAMEHTGLVEKVLEARKEEIRDLAQKTLVEEDADNEERIAEKVQMLMENRREEFMQTNPEVLIDNLIEQEAVERGQQALMLAANGELLVYMLRDTEGKQIFESFPEVKEYFPLEVILSLFQEMNQFMEERGNPEDFTGPHTSEKSLNSPGCVG